MNGEFIINQLKDILNTLSKAKIELSNSDDNLNMAILYLDCCIDRLQRRFKD